MREDVFGLHKWLWLSVLVFPEECWMDAWHKRSDLYYYCCCFGYAKKYPSLEMLKKDKWGETEPVLLMPYALMQPRKRRP